MAAKGTDFYLPVANVSKRVKIEEGPIRWWLGSGVNVDAARPLLRRALDSLARGEIPNLKVGRRKGLYELALARDNAPDYLVKVNHYPPGRGIFRRRRLSKARHEMCVAEEMARRGIPTPLPLAAGDQYEGRRLAACFLLMPIIDDVVDLRRLWFGDTLSCTEKHSLASALGTFSRRMHEAGLFQDDFDPNNFLVRCSDPLELFPIDFERANVRARTSKRARSWMLAKLDRGTARASATDRMRFLHAYAAGDRAEARRWWRAVGQLAPRLARRDLHRMRRKATRVGGPFRYIASDRWTGYARAEVTDAALERALRGLAANAVVQATLDGRAWVVSLPQFGLPRASRVWSAANTLALRGLCPRPLGVLCGDSTSFLVLECSKGASLLTSTKPARATEGALRALFARLFGYGDVNDALDPQGIVVEPTSRGCAQASLLRVETFRFGSSGVPEIPRRVATVVGRLLADLESRREQDR